MPNVLDNGPFVCCEGISGEAEDRYIHLCSCPQVKVFSKQTSYGLVTMIGFPEIAVAHPLLSGLTPNVPPNIYLSRERVFNYNRTVTFDDESDCSGSTESRSSTSPTSVTRTYNATDGTFTDGSPIVFSTQNYNCIDGETRPAGGPSSTSYPQGIDPAIGSATFTQTSISVTFDLSGDNTTGSDTRSEFLSVPDTEQNAINRADTFVSSSHYGESKYEERQTDFTFEYEESEYAVVLTGLVVGLRYKASIPKRTTSFVEGQTANWTDQTPLIITHTATKKFHIEGGALNSDISDDDFVNANYSTNPSSYGLPSGSLVIIPDQTLTLPIQRGVKNQVGITLSKIERN